MKILNCTNHMLTDMQKKMGIIELDENDRETLTSAITFNDPPMKEDVDSAIEKVLEVLSRYEYDACMLGGAPFLAAPLENAILSLGKGAAYAFSKRISKEKHLPDGTVEKISVFETTCTMVRMPDGTIIHITA